jgi:Spy/CpxP family protein refolding chaperone
LHQLILTEKQQTEIKTLLKAQRTALDDKLEDARNIGTEIFHLSFSNDYSDDKIQALFDKAAVIHREIALHRSGLNNAIFKLLTGEQQKKLQSQLEG